MMDRTADGVVITEGLVCYDNNLDVVKVGKPYHTERNEREGRDVIWYRLTTLDGQPDGSADGGRLSTTFRDYNGKRWVAPEPIGKPSS